MPDEDEPRFNRVNRLRNKKVDRTSDNKGLWTTFTRTLKSGDLRHDYDIVLDQPMQVIWAGNPNSGLEDGGSEVADHRSVSHGGATVLSTNYSLGPGAMGRQHCCALWKA